MSSPPPRFVLLLCLRTYPERCCVGTSSPVLLLSVPLCESIVETTSLTTGRPPQGAACAAAAARKLFDDAFCAARWGELVRW